MGKWEPRHVRIDLLACILSQLASSNATHDLTAKQIRLAFHPAFCKTGVAATGSIHKLLRRFFIGFVPSTQQKRLDGILSSVFMVFLS